MSLVVELVKSTFKVDSKYKSDFKQVHGLGLTSYYYVFENRLIELQIKFDSKETIQSVEVFLFKKSITPEIGVSFMRHLNFTYEFYSSFFCELYSSPFLQRHSGFIKQLIVLDSKRNSPEGNNLIKRFAEHIDIDFIELYKYLGA